MKAELIKLPKRRRFPFYRRRRLFKVNSGGSKNPIRCFHGRHIRFFIIGACAVLIIFAAVIINFLSGKGFVMPANAHNLMHGIKPSDTQSSKILTDDFKRSTQNFSVNLFKSTFTSAKNTIVSPASAFLSLGMVENGSSGGTLKEFTNALGKYGMTRNSIDEGCKAYLDSISGKKGKTSLSISNSIWLKSDLNVKKEFLQKNADFFSSEAYSFNFDDKKAVNVLNRWVNSKTDGKINKIIDKIDRDSIMYLINAVYFDGKWANPFDTGTSSRNFFLDDGSCVKSAFMHLNGEIGYVKYKNASCISLPYDDSRFEMLCMLPDSGTTVSEYIKGLSDDTIPSIAKNLSQEDVTLTFPKFTLSGNYKLEKSLQEMGIVTAFEKDADFTDMAENPKEIRMSSFRQSTFLKVDEYGTQAAAATAAGISSSSRTPGKTLIFNRPFIFALIDTKTCIPLFLGTVENPSLS